MCDVQSITSSQSMTSSQSRGDPPAGVDGEIPAGGDPYSEEAMDELERLGDDDVTSDVTRDSNTAAPPAAVSNSTSTSIANSHSTNESQSKSESRNANANAATDNCANSAVSLAASGVGEEAQESRDTFVEATPEDISRRRLSWQDAAGNATDVSNGKSDDVTKDVKLRKAASIDVTRPGSLKKLRAGAAGDAAAKTGGRTAPSPVKATYRPASMPVDALVAQLEDEAEGRRSPDDLTSGGLARQVAVGVMVVKRRVG